MFDRKEYYKRYYTEHKEQYYGDKQKRRCQEYYRSNKEIIRKKQKDYYKANKAEIMENRKKHCYSATLEDLATFYRDCKIQEGKCWICGEVSLYKGLPLLMYDHDHATGIYRGAICNLCNKMLGLVKDQMSILQKAIDYLKGANHHDVCVSDNPDI